MNVKEQITTLEKAILAALEFKDSIRNWPNEHLEYIAGKFAANALIHSSKYIITTLQNQQNQTTKEPI